MFKFFRKRKLDKLVQGAEQAVFFYYCEEPVVSPTVPHQTKNSFALPDPEPEETKEKAAPSEQRPSTRPLPPQSTKDKTESEPRVRYSRQTIKAEPEEGEPIIRRSLQTKPSDFKEDRKDEKKHQSSVSESTRFSDRDRYSSGSVDGAMRFLYADTSPLRAVSVLDKCTNMSFVDKMLEHINANHLRDTDVYKAAGVDRRLYSKIVSDRSYKPSKDTCIALSLAMKLSLPEANDILSRAGYVLSHSSKRDVVIEYFFRERIYDLNDVNEVLFRLDQKILGR